MLSNPFRNIFGRFGPATLTPPATPEAEKHIGIDTKSFPDSPTIEPIITGPLWSEMLDRFSGDDDMPAEDKVSRWHVSPVSATADRDEAGLPVIRLETSSSTSSAPPSPDESFICPEFLVPPTWMAKTDVVKTKPTMKPSAHQVEKTKSESIHSVRNLSTTDETDGHPLGPSVDGNNFAFVSPGEFYHDEPANHGRDRDRISREQAQTSYTVGEMRKTGWSRSATELYYRLNMRGFEALVPFHWHVDFATWPEVLFTPVGGEAYIRALYQPDFHAIKAMARLSHVGPRMRDAYLRDFKTKSTPETILRRELDAFRLWAAIDSGTLINHALPPPMAVVAGSVDVPVEELHAQMAAQMADLGSQWKRAEQRRFGPLFRTRATVLSKLPTLYGIIASGTVFAIVCYDIAPDEGSDTESVPIVVTPRSATPTLGRVTKRTDRSRTKTRVRTSGSVSSTSSSSSSEDIAIDNIVRGRVRTVGMFEFSNPGADVWNALALAIVVVHVRQQMIAISKDWS